MMKKIIRCAFIIFLFITSYGYSQSVVTTTINYTGFLACGGCLVCGGDYYCFNTPGSYCGNTPPCGTKTFIDPVPPGNIVTNILVTYFSANCAGNSLSGTINGNTVPTVNEGSTGCPCSNVQCGASGATSCNYLSSGGMPNYVYGGVNTLVLCTGADVCINRAVLSITYVAPGSVNPLITPSGPTTFCQGGNVTLTADPGYVSYSWNTGATSQAINVTTSGTYVVNVTTSAGCSASGTVVVTVNPTPVISVSSSPANICVGQSSTLNSSVNPAGGTYNWTPGGFNSASVVVSPGATTTYNLAYMTTAGCSGNAAVAVNVSPNPVIAVSVANPTLCSGLSTVLSSTVNIGGGTYNWSPGGFNTANVTISPTSSQNYTLLYTTASGCTAAASASVEVKSPTVTVNNAVICAGLSATLTSNVSPGGGIYSWAPGGQTTSSIVVSPSSTTNYTVNYTSPDGCTNKAVSTVSVNAGPVISINNATICPGVTAILSSIVNPGGGNYLWSPGGQTNPSIAVSPSITTIYVLTYTSTAGCVSSNTAEVVVSAAPTLAVNNATICSGSGASAALVATVSPAGGTFSWNPTGSTSSSIVVMPTVTTNYTLNYITSAGCAAANISTVTVVPGFSSADFLYPANVCLDEQPVILTGTVVSSGTNSYQWFLDSGSSPSTAITPTVSVNYTFPGIKTVTLVVTNNFGCVDTVTHPVNINPLPVLNFATAPTCIGSAASFTNSSWIGGSGVIASWLWDFGNGSTSGAFQPAVTYTAPGTYTVMLVANSDFGCNDTLYKTITINPATLAGSVQSNTTVCSTSNSATLSLNGNNGNVMFWQYSNNGGINWTPLSNTSTAQTYSNLNQTTIYQAYVQSGNCPGAFSNASTITVNAASNGGILKRDTVVCSTANSGTLTVGSFTGAVNDWIFSSNNGQTWSSLSNTLSVYSFSNLATSGLYAAIVKNGICPADTSNSVKVDVLLFQGAVINPYPDTTISIGYSLQIVASGGVQYAWSPNYNISDTTVFNPNVWPTKNTTYTVVVQNNFGCRDVTQVTVFVKNDYKLIIANTVTPNNDGVNDTWWIGNLENYPNNEVMILNRFGQLLYETKGYKNTWDGMHNGQRLPDGTYFFVLKFPESNVIYKGSINIISSR